jgi:monothiol glutaredoxin
MKRLENYHSRAKKVTQSFHPKIVLDIENSIRKHNVVVVGMFLNPYVLWVRLVLWKAGISYHYIQHGGYLSKWRQRLAIKIWSGWPTFPQVFVKGHLIGGNKMTRKALDDGSFQKLLQS